MAHRQEQLDVLKSQTVIDGMRPRNDRRQEPRRLSARRFWELLAERSAAA
jgi:hypothetical protein